MYCEHQHSHRIEEDSQDPCLNVVAGQASSSQWEGKKLTLKAREWDDLNYTALSHEIKVT
jgi:hypothetical protein